jgi:hypothetical protein
MPKYPLFSYDNYFCLKPPLLLWVAVLYLSRAIALPLAVGMGHAAGVSQDATKLLHSFVSLETVVPSALAMTVLYAMCRRQPQASSAVRWIWAHGRSLLAAAAVIDCGLAMYALTRDGDITDLSLPSLIGAGFDLYFLLYILAARRVRDTFADFPLLLTSR